MGGREGVPSAREGTMDIQHERAYQKQAGVNQGFNKTPGLKLAKTAPGKNGKRWYKNVGLGFKTPREAIEGSYIDKKCPFTGNVAIRGRILTGVVHKARMNRTIVVRFDYLHYGTYDIWGCAISLSVCVVIGVDEKRMI